jgi:hypothetical protein
MVVLHSAWHRGIARTIDGETVNATPRSSELHLDFGAAGNSQLHPQEQTSADSASISNA